MTVGDAAVVPGWNPLGARSPAGDDEVLELLAAAVLQARFRPEIVRARWPAIRRAFAGFALATVAAWPDEQVAVLMQDAGIVRNEKKLRAILRNARELQARSRAHGGALAYLRAFEGEDALVRELDGWAHYIGAPSIRWFVRALDGAPAPEAGGR